MNFILLKFEKYNLENLDITVRNNLRDTLTFLRWQAPWFSDD